MSEEATPRKEVIVSMFENKEISQAWSVHVCKADNRCTWCRKEILKGAECFRVKDGLMHIECMKFRESLRPAWWIGEKLGLSSAQFLRIAKLQGLKPGSTYATRFNTEVYLWDPGLVGQFYEHPDVVRARARRKAAGGGA